jgi:RNA polymerase sigma-70 factor (ECF subfamily)
MRRLLYNAPSLDKKTDSSTEPQKISDEELLLRYEGGDHRAFEILFGRYRKKIFYFILRFLRDENASEDAMQDLFLRIIRDPSRFQARSRFSTWLHAVARNLCIDLLRKKKRRRHVSLDTAKKDQQSHFCRTLQEKLPNAKEASIQETSDVFMRVRLLVAIQAIPDEQRVVFLLREVAGLPFAEIAKSVRVPLNTAKSRMRYALINLRQHLQELGIKSLNQED